MNFYSSNRPAGYNKNALIGKLVVHPDKSALFIGRVNCIFEEYVPVLCTSTYTKEHLSIIQFDIAGRLYKCITELCTNPNYSMANESFVSHYGYCSYWTYWIIAAVLEEYNKHCDIEDTKYLIYSLLKVYGLNKESNHGSN
jgi:hypothetical protein